MPAVSAGVLIEVSEVTVERLSPAAVLAFDDLLSLLQEYIARMTNTAEKVKLIFLIALFFGF